MKFQLRRYVWVIDLIGMLVGAGLLGHLVANQIVSGLWPQAGMLEYAPSSPRRAHAVATAAAPPVSGRMTRADALKGIRRIGPRAYEVPRGIFDQVGGLSPPAPVIVPETRDGRSGFRIFSVDPNGLLAALGLRSGDLVVELNDTRLADPDSALLSYLRLKRMTHAWLLIERNEERIRMDYFIR